ncbi:MAG TPA: branched-chain amino acid ABC transporter permease [Trebonia sp.]|nr:branched-chain amino acid ABC transporter permease [Trebonia sp.]
MSQIVLSLGFGLVTASILALGAVGFTLQFGVTNLFNLAFGENMTVSMFVAYLALVSLHWNMWAAMAAGAVAGAVLSLGISRLVYLPFQRRGTSQFAMVMVTVAVSFILKNVLQMFSGATYYSYQLPPEPPIRFLGMVFDARQLAIIGLAATSLLGMHLLFKYTRLGKAMRATSDNAALARSVGIPTNRVVSAAWVLSGLLAGLAGVALAIDLGSFNSGTGGSYLLLIVAAAVFGSVGEPYGAVLGAVVIGLTSEVAAIYYPQLKDVVAFAILVLVLLLRPDGLRAGRVQMRAEVTV